MANGGVLDTSGIMGVIESALNKLNNVAEGASKIEAEIGGANRGTKEWNRTLEETKRHINEIDSAMDGLNDGGAIEAQVKSQKQLQRELNETAKRFLDTQEKLGRFKGFSSDDKLSREITKQFNLIKKGETEFYEARSRINKVVNELATASKNTISAEHFDKVTNAITQATDKLSVFLQEIRDVAKEINSKNFGFNFNLTDTQGESERLEQYKNMWRSYGQAVGDALNEVARLSNDREFKAAAGPDFQRQIAQVGMLAYEYDAMEKSFKKSMQSVKTFAGADTAGKQLQEYAARIQPIIEKAKELGRSDFDINRFLKPEIPAGTLNQAEKLQSILSGITGQAQEVGAVAANANGGATAQALNNESSAVQKLNEMYELHRAAVAAATAAEVEKTNVSKQLLEALTKEGEALRLNEEGNWFANIEKAVSSIDVAVRSINEFHQSFQQLNSAGDSINQNINEPLKQAGEKLREVDVTFLESQLRMVGARMEALRVPSDQMTSSLTAMEDALRNYKDENLPIKDRNAALAAFNENNKTANQLIKEQNYLNQQAAKELNELTRAQDELDKSSAKRLTAEQKTAFDDAKRAIEEYYKAQQMLLKDQKAYSDIKLTNNGYQSQSGNYSALAVELNRTKIAYDLVTDAQNKNQLSADGILKLNQQLAEKQRQYELQLEQANNKEREAAEKAAESARKKQEQAEATERAAKAKQVEAMATQQLKDTEKQNSANAKEVANDYSRMLDLLRKIGKESANKQNFLASGDLIKAADADKWLKKYIADYRTLKLEIGSKLNTKQLEELTYELQNQKRAIEARNAAAKQVAQGDAVKADQTSLKNATTSYNEIIKSFDLLETKSVEVQTAIDNLKSAMEAVRATNPGTEERANAMNVLAQASMNAQTAVTAAAEAERRKAEAATLAAKAEHEHAEAERKSTKESQEIERNESKRVSMLVQVQKELVRAEAAEKKFAAAQHTTGLKDTYNDLKNTTSQLRDLEQQLRSGVPPTTEMRNQFAQLRSELTRTTADLQLNGNALGRWFTSGVSQLQGRLSSTLGLAAMVYKAVGEVKKMVSTAVELDSAMNTLQIVTRSSGAEMETYGKRVSAMAKETAQATKDLIDATTVYARLGYTMDESATLSKYTAMLQGVGDIGASEAQDAMTAIIKAFGKNVDDIEEVMDKLVVVGNNFPISVSQLAEGMNNASSMLAVAGNSFEQSVALLTAANTTIQNVSKASTGLRTIAARIRKTNTDEEDGEVVEEAKYQEMVNALTKKHVDLIDKVTGQYRSTYDIMRDISRVWDKLNTMEQAAVIEALAGTRQQNIFTSLVTQFQEAEDALVRMNTSAGELQDSYDIYLNSIQAHVQTLKAAYDELSVDFVDSDFAKSAVDILTSIVEALDVLISKFGVWKTALGAIAGVSAIKNFEKLKALFVGTEVTKGGAWLFEAPDKFEKLATAIMNVNPAVLAAIASVGILIAGLTKLDQMHSLEYATKQVDETRRQIESLNDQQEINNQKIEVLNTLKARGDFSVQQETELTILQTQNTVLESQIALLEERNKKEREHQQELARGQVNDLLTTGVVPNTHIPATQATSLRGAVRNYREWQKAAQAHPDYKGTQAQFEAASHTLEKMLRDAPELMALLDPEKDKDLIDKFNVSLQEASDTIAGIPQHIRNARNELEQIQKGGNVNLLQRPVIDSKILEAAGWGEFVDGEGSTIFSETFSNEDNTVAMNFTPIITDVDGNYVGAFTPEQLQRYAEAVIAGTQEDSLGLKIGATFEGPDAINQAVEEAKKVHELHELIYEEDLKKIQKFHKDVKSLSSGTIEAIKKYIQDGTKLSKDQAKELQDFLDRTKYSADTFAQMFSQMFAEAPDGLSNTVQQSTGDLAAFHDELIKTNKALEQYKKYMEGGEKDDAVKEAAEIYKGAMEDIQSGRIDTNRLHAAAELFLGKDRLTALGWDMQKVAKELQGDMWKYLFDPEEANQTLDYGQRFADYVRQNFSAANGVWMEGNNFFYNSLQDVADAFHMSTDAAGMFLSALDMYGVNTMRSTEDNQQLIYTFRQLRDELGGADEAVRQMVRDMHADGLDDFEIHTVLEDLRQAGFIDLNKDQLHNSVDEVLTELDELDQKEAEPTTSMNYEPFTMGYNDVVRLMNELNSLVATPTVIMGSQMSGVENEQSSSDTSGKANMSAGGHYTKPSRAGGKRSWQGGGDTLVNELGPELISDNGKAFIANGGKPGFVHLSDDAIVFTAKETKDILKGKRSVNGKALAGGNVGRGSLIGRLMSGKIQARAYIRCPVCGTANPDSRASCYSCGASLHGGSAASVNNSRGTTGSSNAGVNRSAYGSPTAVTTGQNMGGNGYYYSPTTQTITYTTYTYDESSGLGKGNVNDYGSFQSMEQAARRAQEKLEAELYKARQKAIKDANAAQGVNWTSPKSIGGNGLSGSGGGNHVGGSDYGSSSDPQKVDWIAVRINRLQRTIADLEKVASSGFKKLDKRLSATKEQIKKTSEEISDMDRAYYRYMAEADSVGLSSDLVHLVREGAIDINEYDDETREKIDQYTEWYEKALDAKSAIEELHQDIAQLYVDSFDAVQTDFENQLAQIEHSANMTSKHLEMAQTKGYLDSANFYEQLASDQEKTVTKLGAELDELNAKMKEAMKSGEIDEGSEAWYQMKASINEVEEALADANIQLVQYQRTIRQLDWTYFDYAQERMSQLNAETQFFVDLMAHHDLFNDNGQFNNLGEATAGLHAVNYDMYMEQAEAYAEQIGKIQKDLESDPYDTELIKRREQLLDLQRQSISSAEGEKEALKSLVQEGVNKELEALKDLIDTYKDSLDSAKNLYEYQKKVTEQTSDIASLQKQLAAYQGDTSEENRARVQKLQNDLRKAQTDLRETEWDQNISDQKKLLDDMYDEYEDLLNTRLDNIDLLMQEMIAGTNANMDSIRNTMIEVGDEVGYSMTDQLTQALSNDLSYYDHVFEGINSVHLVLTNIYDMVSAMARASGAVKAYATGGLVDYTGLAAVHGTKSHPELMLNANDTVNFLEAAKLMRDTFTGTKLSGLPGAGESGSGVGIGQLVVNIPIERVQDYNDFVRQLQNDPKFDRLISAMTLDRTLGKSAFGKNRIMF